MVDIRGVDKTPIYRNRLLRRYMIANVVNEINTTGQLNGPYAKLAPPFLKMLDKEMAEFGTLKTRLCQKVYV